MNRLLKLIKSLGRGIRALSPSCRDASRLQSEALDRELPLLRRVGLWIHLRLCKWCRRYGKQLRFLRGVAGKCQEHEQHAAPQWLSSEARERIRKRLESEK